MSRVVLLGSCPDSLHKAEVWAYVLGLHSGPAHVLLSAPLIASSPWLKQAQTRDEAFLESVAASTWLTGDGLI